MKNLAQSQFQLHCRPTKPRHQVRPSSGFTLIEIMVTVAIIAILSAIALPAYSDYVTRGKIPEAVSNLGTKSLQIEQWFLDNRTYVGATACASDTTTSRYFDFSCSVSNATTFTLLATGKSSMLGFTYSIAPNNAKTTVAVPTGWSLPTTNNCWVTNKGGVC